MITDFLNDIYGHGANGDVTTRRDHTLIHLYSFLRFRSIFFGFCQGYRARSDLIHLSYCLVDRVISRLVFVPTDALRDRESFTDTATYCVHFIILAPPMKMLFDEGFLSFLDLPWRLASRVPQEAVHIFHTEIIVDSLLVNHLKRWLLVHAQHGCVGYCDSHARR